MLWEKDTTVKKNGTQILLNDNIALVAPLFLFIYLFIYLFIIIIIIIIL